MCTFNWEALEALPKEQTKKELRASKTTSGYSGQQELQTYQLFCNEHDAKYRLWQNTTLPSAQGLGRNVLFNLQSSPNIGSTKENKGKWVCLSW